ncbi:MAG: hypothetical protein IKJ82_03310 [Oscillospiraceae bacterium]|nr:hypothetical protein [Oscillospiraceae bacterium]
MLIVNGTDYGLLIICVLAFAAIAVLQYFLCAKAKNKILKFLPCVFGLFFIIGGIAAQFGSSGGFLDMSGFVTFLCLAAAGLCFLAQGVGFFAFKLRKSKTKEG